MRHGPPRPRRHCRPPSPRHPARQWRCAYLLFRPRLCALSRPAPRALPRGGVAVWAWCLMPNHAHLVLVPSDDDGLRRALALYDGPGRFGPLSVGSSDAGSARLSGCPSKSRRPLPAGIDTLPLRRNRNSARPLPEHRTSAPSDQRNTQPTITLTSGDGPSSRRHLGRGCATMWSVTQMSPQLTPGYQEWPCRPACRARRTRSSPVRPRSP